MDRDSDRKRRNNVDTRDRPRRSDRDPPNPRSRSRSRSRSRERRRHRDDRDDRYRRRRSDDDDWRRQDRDERPRRRLANETVVYLEKVPARATQYDISYQFGRDSSIIKDIQVYNRGDCKTATIHFHNSAEAMQWYQDNKDNFYLFDEKIKLATNINRDWTCFKCGKLNFVRRSHCMECDCSRRESDSLHQDVREGRIPAPKSYDEDSETRTVPANVLIIGGLDALTVEKDVVDAIGCISNVRMLDVRVIRDRSTNTSRGFCFVTLNDIKEATELLEKLNSQYPSFFVQGKRVMVDYARPKHPQSSNKKGGNTVATDAIAQAQWSNVDAGKSAQENEQSSMQQAYQQGNATATAVETTQDTTTTSEDTNNLAGYSYDATSGFYYDPKTGLYYDPKTQYHYNSQTGQYCYYDPTQLKYVPVDNEGNPITSSDSTTAQFGTDNKKKKDGASSLVSSSTMDAKKIAKNMERWAKSVNAAKAAQKQQISMVIQQERIETTTVAEALPRVTKMGGALKGPSEVTRGGISLVSALKDPDEDSPLLATHPVDVQDATVVHPATKVSIPRGADINPAHTDWEQLACLLCKRKFPSKEVLFKHQQFSELHKQNLQKEKSQPQQTKGLPDVGVTKAKEAMQKYRDRAQERRDKVGTQAIIPGWKKSIEREIAQESFIPYEQPTVNGLTEDNIGNKMLMAMGWSGGQGLGKSNQGITEPIKAEMRQSSAGLGAPGSTYGYVAGDDYKRNVKAMTQARYNETL